MTDRAAVRSAMAGADAVLHTATLHKPHVGSHSRQEFVDTNVTGTLVLLEEAVGAGVGAFVATSTTSAFGRALTPGDGAPAAWITEDVVPRPRNIYGASKVAAEDLCELIARDHGLPCVVLRTSRFFPEADDSEQVRSGYADANAKVNELLYRRIDLEDVVGAHLAALERAAAVGFGRYVVSATHAVRPRRPRGAAPRRTGRGGRLFPDYAEVYERLGWRMFPRIDRVYVNARARAELGWSPRYDFATRPRAPSRGAAAAQRARDQHRSQGLPPGDDGAIHDTRVTAATPDGRDHGAAVVIGRYVRHLSAGTRPSTEGRRPDTAELRAARRPARPGTHGSSG